MRDALAPNLVQTLERNPAFVHGGPFANIAHGCSSLISMKAGSALADVVITEAGFGADLGAEKFLDIAARVSGRDPDVAVLVATVRALKYHGGVHAADLGTEDVEALRRGLANLDRHLQNLDGFGLPVIVAINRFPTDTAAELTALAELLDERGVSCAPCTDFAEGGVGASELAKLVLSRLDGPAPAIHRPYELDAPLSEKIERLATTVYRATSVAYSTTARHRLGQLESEGFGGLPVCIAKTQYSFSTDASRLGAPDDHALEVTEVCLAAGAGFAVVICGALTRMPGLPARPAALGMTIADDGTISGLS